MHRGICRNVLLLTLPATVFSLQVREKTIKIGQTGDTARAHGDGAGTYYSQVSFRSAHVVRSAPVGGVRTPQAMFGPGQGSEAEPAGTDKEIKTLKEGSEELVLRVLSHFGLIQTATTWKRPDEWRKPPETVALFCPETGMCTLGIVIVVKTFVSSLCYPLFLSLCRFLADSVAGRASRSRAEADIYRNCDLKRVAVRLSVVSMSRHWVLCDLLSAFLHQILMSFGLTFLVPRTARPKDDD